MKSAYYYKDGSQGVGILLAHGDDKADDQLMAEAIAEAEKTGLAALVSEEVEEETLHSDTLKDRIHIGDWPE